MKFSLVSLFLASFLVAGASANCCDDVCVTTGEGKDPNGRTPYGCNPNIEGSVYFTCQEGQGEGCNYYTEAEWFAPNGGSTRKGYCLYLTKEGASAQLEDDCSTGAPTEAPTDSPVATPATDAPTESPTAPPTPVECVEPEEPDFPPGSDATCGHSCGCFTCGAVVDNGDNTISITVEHCKSGSISWMCCTGYDGEEGNCQVTGCSPESGTAKCSSVGPSDFVITLPADASTFTINTHDGQTQGNGDMNNAICGGNGNQGGKCAKKGSEYTAHCEIEFDIATECACPTTR